MKWVLKTSSIIVDTDEGKSVFRSLDECPPDVKRRLRETLPGPNACTIMITNREALEAIRKRSITKAARVGQESTAPKVATRRIEVPRWQLRALSLLAGVATLVGLLAWAMHSG